MLCRVTCVSLTIVMRADMVALPYAAMAFLLGDIVEAVKENEEHGAAYIHIGDIWGKASGIENDGVEKSATAVSA